MYKRYPNFISDTAMAKYPLIVIFKFNPEFQTYSINAKPVSPLCNNLNLKKLIIVSYPSELLNTCFVGTYKF